MPDHLQRQRDGNLSRIAVNYGHEVQAHGSAPDVVSSRNVRIRELG
ncbi:hypothetical protein [uncultured Nocardioides sp.]|nr:hypothetical protein [uncultured Nocardioides sp.]